MCRVNGRGKKKRRKGPSTNELNSTLINFSGFVVVTLIWHNEGIHGNNMNCSWPPQLLYYSVNKDIMGLWEMRSGGQEMVIKVLVRGTVDPLISRKAFITGYYWPANYKVEV